jgi:hypothetical protein
MSTSICPSEMSTEYFSVQLSLVLYAAIIPEHNFRLIGGQCSVIWNSITELNCIPVNFVYCDRQTRVVKIKYGKAL